MEDKKRRMTEQEIEAAIQQANAMSIIADGYIPSEEENEISRKCLRGEMSWAEGMKLIMNLPVSGKRTHSSSD